MPQLDKATFNHQLIIVSLSFLGIYLTLSLLTMPKLFSNSFTRKLFFRLSKFSILQRYLDIYSQEQREKYNFLFLYAKFESDFSRTFDMALNSLSQNSSVIKLAEELSEHFREEFLDLRLELKTFQKFL